MYLSAFSRNIKDSLLNFWNILAKCCVVTGSIFSRLRTNTSIIKSWHLPICRGLLDITMINEVILQLGCLFNHYDQAWYWPKKKTLENHNFGKKSFILDKKQTEKLLAKVKKIGILIKTGKIPCLYDKSMFTMTYSSTSYKVLFVFEIIARIEYEEIL